MTAPARIGAAVSPVAALVFVLAASGVQTDREERVTDPVAATGVPGEAPRAERIELPEPALDGSVSLERTLATRRSRRAFGDEAPDLAVVAQLVWAAQGVTTRDGRRTAPSAGALYPLELFVAAGEVEELPAGVYRYLPARHALEETRRGDVRSALARAALAQVWVREAPLVLVFGAVYGRTTRKYGERGRRYVHIEVGSAAQNVYLQAEADGWTTVFVGAFDDTEVTRILGGNARVSPLGMMPVGHPRR